MKNQNKKYYESRGKEVIGTSKFKKPAAPNAAPRRVTKPIESKPATPRPTKPSNPPPPPRPTPKPPKPKPAKPQKQLPNKPSKQPKPLPSKPVKVFESEGKSGEKFKKPRPPRSSRPEPVYERRKPKPQPPPLPPKQPKPPKPSKPSKPSKPLPPRPIKPVTKPKPKINIETKSFTRESEVPEFKPLDILNNGLQVAGTIDHESSNEIFFNQIAESSVGEFIFRGTEWHCVVFTITPENRVSYAPKLEVISQQRSGETITHYKNAFIVKFGPVNDLIFKNVVNAYEYVSDMIDYFLTRVPVDNVAKYRIITYNYRLKPSDLLKPTNPRPETVPVHSSKFAKDGLQEFKRMILNKLLPKDQVNTSGNYYQVLTGFDIDMLISIDEGNGIGRGNGPIKTLQNIEKNYYQVYSYNIENCGYAAIEVAIKYKKYPLLLSDRPDGARARVTYATKLKSIMKKYVRENYPVYALPDSGIDFTVLQLIADYYSLNIEVYDAAFKLIFKTEINAEMREKSKSLFSSFRYDEIIHDIKLKLDDCHYEALIPRKDLINIILDGEKVSEKKSMPIYAIAKSIIIEKSKEYKKYKATLNKDSNNDDIKSIPPLPIPMNETELFNLSYDEHIDAFDDKNYKFGEDISDYDFEKLLNDYYQRDLADIKYEKYLAKCKNKDEIDYLEGHKFEYLKGVSRKNEKYHPHRRDNVVLSCFDVESAPDETLTKEEWFHKAYALGYTYGNSQQERVNNKIKFIGLDCWNQFFNYLSDLSAKLYESDKKLLVMAHNGAKFDMNILFNYKQDKFKVELGSAISSNNRWITVTMYSQHVVNNNGNINSVNIPVKFMDTYSILSASLDKLAKSFDCEYLKLGDTVPHHLINLQNFQESIEKYNIEKYLDHDILSLGEIIEKFNNIVYEPDVDEYNHSIKRKISIIERRLKAAYTKQFNDESEKSEISKSSQSNYKNAKNMKSLALYMKNKNLEKPKNDINEKIEKYEAELELLKSQIKHKKFGIHLYDIPTASSFAKHLFFYKYYQPNSMGIYSLPIAVDKFIRFSYRGGNTQNYFTGDTREIQNVDENGNLVWIKCSVNDKDTWVDEYGQYWTAQKGKVYYYDVSSMYPFTATKNLPYGIPKYIKYTNEPIIDVEPVKSPSKIDIKDFECFRNDQGTIYLNQPNEPDDVRFGFFEVIVSGGINQFGAKTQLKQLHAHKGKECEGRTIFPYYDNPTREVLFSEEIKRGMKYGYKYQFIQGFEYEKGKTLAKIMSELYDLKNKYKESDPVLAQVYKLVINSLYGIFGLDFTNRKSASFISHQDLIKLYNEEKLSAVTKLENQEGYITVIEQEISSKYLNVGVAAAITSYARCYLHQLMMDCEECGLTVLYCDTDSIMLNGPMPHHVKYGYVDENGTTIPGYNSNCEFDENGNIVNYALGAVANEADEKLKQHEIKEADKVIDKAKDVIRKQHPDLTEKQLKEHFKSITGFLDDARKEMESKGLPDYIIERKLTNLKLDQFLPKESKIRSNDNSEACFDYGKLHQPKNYALVKVNVNGGKNYEQCMLKGYCQRKHSERLTNIETEQKATFDMYIKLEKGEKIINKQKQFKCPISHYMMSHERFGVLEYDTERTIRYKDDDGKIIYSKGIVIEQDIKFDEDYIVNNKVIIPKGFVLQRGFILPPRI